MEVKQSGVRPGRPYRDTGPSASTHYEKCRQQALAAVPIPSQSKDESEEPHAVSRRSLTVSVRRLRCRHDDLSREYVSKCGAPDGLLTSRWTSWRTIQVC